MDQEKKLCQERHKQVKQSSKYRSNLKIIRNDKDIHLKYTLKLMDSLVNSIILYACEILTINAKLKKKFLAFEMKNFRKLLYLDRITNLEIVECILAWLTSAFTNILTTVKRRKLKSADMWPEKWTCQDNTWRWKHWR